MERKDLIEKLKDIKLVYDEIKKYEDLQIEPTFNEEKPNPSSYYGDEPKVVSKPNEPRVNKTSLKEFCNIDYLNQTFETKTLPSGLKYKLPILGTEDTHNHSFDITMNFCIKKGWTWGSYIQSKKNIIWTKDNVICNIIKPGTKIGNFTVDDKEIYVCGNKSNFIKDHDGIYWSEVYSYIQTTSKSYIDYFENSLIKYDKEITEYENKMVNYNTYLEDKKAYDKSVKTYKEALSLYNKNKKGYDQKLASYKSVKDDLPSLIETKTNELKKICDNTGYPLKYAKDVENIIELIDDYRADTIKEAINLYFSIKSQNEIVSLLKDISRSVSQLDINIDVESDILSAARRIGRAKASGDRRWFNDI